MALRGSFKLGTSTGSGGGEVTEPLRRQGSIRKVVHPTPDNEPVYGEAAKILQRPSHDNQLPLSHSALVVHQEYSILAEFNMVLHNRTPGLYIIPSAKTPLVWFGVLFVRSGPFYGGVFRFNVILPENFPGSTRPRVIFEMDIFHPSIDDETKELNLKPAFPEWRKDAHHVWQVLQYTADAFNEINLKSPINIEAANMCYNNLGEFESLAGKCASESLSVLYNVPSQCEDVHYLRFHEYNEKVHGETRKDITSPVPELNGRTTTKCMGLSWVRQGTLEPFSKHFS